MLPGVRKSKKCECSNFSKVAQAFDVSKGLFIWFVRQSKGAKTNEELEKRNRYLRRAPEGGFIKIISEIRGI